MSYQTLQLTAEEAVELSLTLSQETASAAVELRHTASRDYRDRIRHRMDLIASILTKLDLSMPQEQHSA